MLRKNPGFAAVVTLTLALGIGANTAIFSVFNSVLLKPLPFREPNRLVIIWETVTKSRVTTSPVSSSDFLDWKDQTQVFEQIAAWRFLYFNLSGRESGEVLRLVLRQGMGLTLAGLFIGLFAALAAAGLLSSFLFGVRPTDPASFASVALLLGGAALLACYIPARRAIRVDPMVALRHE
jgi:hypothetical protein